MEDAETVDEFVTEQDVKLYRLSTVAASRLGNWTEIGFQNPVEVLSGTQRIGWASLEVQVMHDYSHSFSRRILAEIVLDGATPERLDIETKARPLYARVEGVCELGVEPWEHIGLVHDLLPELKSLQVLGLQISDTPGFEGQSALGEVVL